MISLVDYLHDVDEVHVDSRSACFNPCSANPTKVAPWITQLLWPLRSVLPIESLGPCADEWIHRQRRRPSHNRPSDTPSSSSTKMKISAILHLLEVYLSRRVCDGMIPEYIRINGPPRVLLSSDNVKVGSRRSHDTSRAALADVSHIFPYPNSYPFI